MSKAVDMALQGEPEDTIKVERVNPFGWSKCDYIAVGRAAKDVSRCKSKLAQKGHYPAIDVLDSVSRVAQAVADDAHKAAMRQAGRMLALYREVEELVRIGAYARGADPETDTAIDLSGAFESMLTQSVEEHAEFERSRSELLRLAMESGERIRRVREQEALRGAGGG